MRPSSRRVCSVCIGIVGASCCSLFSCGARTGLPFGDGPPVVNDAGSDAVIIPPDASPPAARLFAGNSYACLVNDGALSCWGYAPPAGWPGDATTMDRLRPAPVAGIPGRVAEIAFSAAPCARLEDGRVFCWGYNSDGELGNGSGNPAVTNTPSQVVGITSAVSLATGVDSYHSCAKLADGTAWCWGRNGYSGYDGPTFDTSPGAAPEEPVPIHAAALDPATRITLGFASTCALFPDGSVRCAGTNSSGECGTGTTSAAVLEFTPVVQIPPAVDVLAFDPGAIALMPDHSVWYWGNHDATSEFETPGPMQLHGVTNVRALAGFCLLLLDDTVACFGTASEGDFGDGGGAFEAAQPETPRVVPGLTGVFQLVTGDGFACALLYDGRVLCWGYNQHGQLGDGTTTNRATPTEVQF
jgi:hypothetical protein